ncbi:hypothetical protein Peur_011054 [Populus x canadensis]
MQNFSMYNNGSHMLVVELEADKLNAYDAASGLNKLVFPEFYLLGALCISFLLTGHWFACILALPNLYHHVRSYMKRQHLVQAVDIFNQLKWEKQKRWYDDLFGDPFHGCYGGAALAFS